MHWHNRERLTLELVEILASLQRLLAAWEEQSGDILTGAGVTWPPLLLDGWLHVHGLPTRRGSGYHRSGGWCDSLLRISLFQAHFSVCVFPGGKLGVLLSRSALGYNLVISCMCKYPVGAVMWYTLYKKKIQISSGCLCTIQTIKNIQVNPPVWFDGFLTF